MKKQSILETYEKNAEYFHQSRNRDVTPERKYLDVMTSMLKKGDIILDIGCGTGRPIAEYFLKQGFQVFGVDGAINMIEIAKKNFPKARWQVADMRTLNLSEKFQAAIAWDSFFHLDHDEQKKMFPIFAKHLMKNAVLIFTSGPEHGEAYGKVNEDVVYHASFSTDEYHQMLKENGFSVLDHQVNDPDCGGHTVWTVQKVI